MQTARLALLALSASATWVPRDVQIINGSWVNRVTGEGEVWNGTNVIMKGPPWIPSTNASAPCNASEACSTFTDADALYLRSRGMRAIRLGVIWAGGQPNPTDALDADFEARLHAFLELCGRHGLRVMLDIHQDAVGTAMCGEGVPMWYTQKHFPHLIGKPVLGPKTKFLKGNCSLLDKNKLWELHAGDPLYNVKNPCCLAWNAPGGWGSNIDVTDFSQAQITQLVATDAGRSAYAAYVRLLAQSVAQYPAAVSIELMNEPPTIQGSALYRLYKACYDAVRDVAPDMALGVADTGSDVPSASDSRLAKDVRAWLRDPNTTGLFYAFHCYSCKLPDTVTNAVKLAALWNAPAFLTEFGTAEAGPAADAAGVGWTHYQYNGYCNVPCGQGQNTCKPMPGTNRTCLPGMPCAFGACIT